MRGYILSILLSCLGFLAMADSLTIDKSDWEERSKSLDYSENVKRKEAEKQDESSNSEIDFNESKPNPLGSFLSKDIVKTILFSVLILAALIIIIIIIKNAKAPAQINAPKMEAKTLEEAEENLPDVELNNLLNDATSSGNWRVALRIQFLMLLQELIYADLIIWKKRKTNEQFVSEISDRVIQKEFKKTVDVFDPAWYGNIPISEAEFNQINGVIQVLHNSLKGGE